MKMIFYLIFLLIFVPKYALSYSGKSDYFAAIVFSIFVIITLLITFFASKKTKDKKSFYAAGGKISGFQNGLAIAGDYMSAASFLGISGLVFFITPLTSFIMAWAK